ncbi:MAG: outer membrane protein precursor [Pseudomonadota bacterium]
MRPALPLTCAASLLLAITLPAAAQTSPWTLRTGPARVTLHTETRLSVAGNDVPGAAVAASGSTLVGLELGRRLDEAWTARLAIGLPPPESTLRTAGSLQAMVPPLSGTLGRVQYAPLVLTATWSPGRWGALQPYVGAGINHTRITRTEDGDLSGLTVDHAWGSVLQLGASWALDARWALFADARTVRLKTTARGQLTALGGLPAEAKVRLDPTIVHIGLEYRP